VRPPPKISFFIGPTTLWGVPKKKGGKNLNAPPGKNSSPGNFKNPARVKIPHRGILKPLCKPPKEGPQPGANKTPGGSLNSLGNFNQVLKMANQPASKPWKLKS